jgi:hypothetical protein
MEHIQVGGTKLWLNVLDINREAENQAKAMNVGCSRGFVICDL